MVVGVPNQGASGPDRSPPGGSPADRPRGGQPVRQWRDARGLGASARVAGERRRTSAAGGQAGRALGFRTADGGWAGATLPGEGDPGLRAFHQDRFHPAAYRLHLTAPCLDHGLLRAFEGSDSVIGRAHSSGHCGKDWAASRVISGQMRWLSRRAERKRRKRDQQVARRPGTDARAGSPKSAGRSRPRGGGPSGGRKRTGPGRTRCSGGSIRQGPRPLRAGDEARRRAGRNVPGRHCRRRKSARSSGPRPERRRGIPVRPHRRAG